MSFSNNLAALMDKRKVSQVDLAKSVGCAQSTINRILAGDQDDSKKYSRYSPAIAQYFGVSLEELLGTDDVPDYLKRSAERLSSSPDDAPRSAVLAGKPDQSAPIGRLSPLAAAASMLVLWDRDTPQVPVNSGAILAIFYEKPDNLAFVAAKVGDRIEILQHIHTRITGSRYYRVDCDTPEEVTDPDVLGPFAIFPVSN